MFGVCAQPQYRVFVDPPVLVSGLPVGVTAHSLSVIVCFREANSMNGANLDYCPLGMITIRANSVNDPPQELALREGAENIPPAYPTAVGLYVVIVRNNNMMLAAHQFLQIDTTPEMLSYAGPTSTTIGSPVLVTVVFRVDCVLGSICTTPQMTSKPLTVSWR